MKRWLCRLLIAAALIVVAGGVFFESVTHVGRGRWYGEPFYEGRPASYWANEIERWDTQDAVWNNRRYERRPTWPRWIERMLPEPRWPSLLDGDPDGLAVLQALRSHPSSEVQEWARLGIERIDNDERGPYKICHPSVIVSARLYEVDEAFYQELAKANWFSMADLEKMELIRLDGAGKKTTGESLFDRLGKQKFLQEAKEIKIESNQEGGLLSATKQNNCLPSPAQMRKGHNGPQTFETGITLRAEVQVSSDRRFIRVKFVERNTQLEGIDKARVILDNRGTEAVAEIACIKESIFATVRNAPDGGVFLLPLQSQPDGANAKGRRLVARVEMRIYIEAEERRLRGEPDK